MSHSGLLPLSIWKHAIRIYRGLPNWFPLYSVSTSTIKQTSWCMGALNLFILSLKLYLQAHCSICRFVNSWVIVRNAGCQRTATVLMYPYWHDQRIAHVRSEMGTWKTSRLRKKERTPLGNTIFECEGWTDTTIACEEFYFAQPLKLWNSSQHKKWKKPTREQTAHLWTSLGHLEFLLRLNYTPAWITLLFIIKAFHSNTLFTQITKQVTTTSICKLVLNWNIS